MKKKLFAPGVYVIARCYYAGVHAGEIEEISATHVTLRTSRRIFGWDFGPTNLSELAIKGFGAGARTQVCDRVTVRLLSSDVYELLICSPEGRASIEACPDMVRS